jgi:hypothetical protein
LKFGLLKFWSILLGGWVVDGVGFGCSSIEFTRIKVPEEFDMEVMRMDLNDPYIRYRAGFHERAIYQTAYNDMVFLHDKVAITIF